MRITAAALLLLLFGLPLLAETNAVSVPFTTNSDGMVILPATVGDTISAQVIFDTGAGLDILAPSLIEKAHGKPAGQFTGFRMTGEQLNIPLFVIPGLSIGPVEKKDVLVGSWDVLDKMHLDGIVSLNDLRQQSVTFDFVKKVVIFETADSLAKRRATEISAPVKFDDQRGITLDVFAEFLFNNQLGQCEVDTGSPNATVSTRYMERLGIQKDGKDVRKIERRTVAGAPQTRYDTVLAKISLAAAPQIGLAHAAASFSDIIYDCVVGLDFWAGKALTIDIPGREILVSSPSKQIH